MEKEVSLSDLERLKRRKYQKKWKNIKIKTYTYNHVKRLSGILGIEKYKIIDLSVIVLSMLIREKLIFTQDEIFDLGLDKCRPRYGYDEKTGRDWGEVSPLCALKKLILPYLWRKKTNEKFIENVKNLEENLDEDLDEFSN